MSTPKKPVTMKENTIETTDYKTFYLHYIPRMLGKNTKGCDCTQINSIPIKCRKFVTVRTYSDGRETIQNVFWKNVSPDLPHNSMYNIKQFDDRDIGKLLEGVKMVKTTHDIKAYAQALISEFTMRKEEAMKTVQRFDGYITELSKQL